MGNSTEGESTFPLYYEDHNNRLCPFIVAPLARVQDTIVMGPKWLTEHRQVLKSILFGQDIGATGNIILRRFSLNKHQGASIALVTSEHDESGRTGLVLVIGILADSTMVQVYPDAAVEFLSFFLQALNRHLKTNLPLEGSETILRAIEAARTDNAARAKLYDVLSAVTLAGNLAAQFTAATSKLTKLFGWSRLKPRSEPKVILYDVKCDVSDLLAAVMSKMKNCAVMSLAGTTVESVGGKTIIAPIQLQGLESNSVKRAQLRVRRGKVFIYLY